MSVADANRFRALEARVNAITGVPTAAPAGGVGLEAITALERRIASLEHRLNMQQGIINGLRAKLGQKPDAAAG